MSREFDADLGSARRTPNGTSRKPSPNAAAELMAAVADDFENLEALLDLDDLEGATDCEEGCTVEPDGHCPHGFESAALTAGVI